jgi:hypothetical protein
MDRLTTCIEALQVLARLNDPDREALVQQYIGAYIRTEKLEMIPALKRLQKAIRYHEEFDRREGEDWRFAREYVRSLLHRMTS